MPTTQDDIRRWLDEAREKDATHMIVAVDTFSYDDYPVFVTPGQDVRERVDEVGAESMQRVMEVYSMAGDLDAQVAERRAYHFD